MSVVDRVADLQLDRGQEALEAAEAALANDPSSASARRAKLVALVELDRFRDVLKFADKTTDAAFVAYALYRLERLGELRELLNGIKNAPLAAQLALAQAEYKLGSIDTARTLLKGIQPLLSTDEGALADLETNLLAIDAAQGLLADFNNGESDFESAFNTARSLLYRGEFSKAREALTVAKQLANDDEEELSCDVQLCAVDLLSTNENEFEKGYSESQRQLQLLENNKLAGFDAVVRNNAAVALARRGAPVHELLRTLLPAEKRVCKQSLTSADRQVLDRNVLKVLAVAGKRHVLKRARSHSEAHTTDLEPLVLALNSQKSRREVNKLRAQPKGELFADAARALSLSQEGRPLPRTHTLKPNSLGSLATVLETEVEDLMNLNEFFNSFRDQQIVEAGRSLLDPESVDPLTLDVGDLCNNVDLQKLESAEFEFVRKEAPAAAKPKRKRRRKLPAHIDPAKTPDPERWLAKQDRRGFKDGRTQGAAANPSSAAATTSSQSTPSAPVAGPGKSANKRKKRGKK